MSKEPKKLKKGQRESEIIKKLLRRVIKEKNVK